MTRRLVALATSTLLVATALWLPGPASAQTPPKSMAATGDSITRAFNLCFLPFTDCPAQSWSTGTNTTVNSHARRLKITSTAYNDAVSGAKMANLPGQVTTVFGRNVDYVTVLMGGNDVCTDTEGQMTSPSAYETDFRTAMDRLAADTTPPLVYVLSVPNVKVLWEVLKDNSTARSRWSSYNICQSLLANPLSTAQVDVDRRERVKQRNMELNQRLRAACAAYAFCRFDGERVFGTPFVPNDVSTRDYFHPSTAGQAKLADVSFTYGPYATSAVNAAPSPGFTASCTGLTCTFTDTSTDADGVTAWSWNFDAASSAGPTSVVRSPTHTFGAAGTYTVKLFAIDRYGATASTSTAVTVSTGGSEPTTGAIGGTVTDASTGEPIDGAAITISGTAAATATTGSDGTYFVPELAPGTYSVAASATGYDPAPSRSVTVEVGRTADASFSLTATPPPDPDPDPPPPDGDATAISVGGLSAATASMRNTWTATVTVRVVDGTGAPVPGVAVAGTWAPGSAGGCTTLGDGSCTVEASFAKSTSSATYSVTNLTKQDLTYDPSADVASRITVTKP